MSEISSKSAFTFLKNWMSASELNWTHTSKYFDNLKVHAGIKLNANKHIYENVEFGGRM